MKKALWRLLALSLSLVMLVSCLASCSKDDGEKDDPNSGVTEVGTEEELTAVRENLIKYAEIEGLGDIEKMEFYENGVRTTSDEYVLVKDNKKIYYSGDIKRVVNYADGYILDMPQDWVPDYSLATLRVRYETEEVSLIASREEQVIGHYYADAEEYLTTLYEFISDPAYHKNNKVTVVEDKKIIEIDEDWKAQVYRLKLEDCLEGTKCYYTYVDYYDNLNDSYHFMFKCVDDRDFSDVYMSFRSIYDKGAAVDTKVYPCENNPNWNEETTAYYEALKEQDYVQWGLFAYRLQTTGWKVSIPVMEKKLDYTFPIISEYIHYSHEFPLEFANTCHEDGRVMQISYQYTINNNSDLTDVSPALTIYRGQGDDVLREFAQGAADYGHPFFFRLNNEMNTDWTSYCAMANMLDPDIFVESWIRLYDIFTETGANQYAMWIFNGFDGSFPPFNWCEYRTYMPDAQYIDLIGLTGYNSGTVEDNTWRSFETIYDNIYNMYEPHFADWPWIISEFGCAAREGASKSEWVTEMFNVLSTGKYPQLKVAIWFDASDYADGVAINDFNIEDDPEVLQAFKDGLELTQP